MDSKEKAKQLEKAEGSGERAQEEKNDLDIFIPEPVELKLGKKKYFLKPLKLSQMRLLARLAKTQVAGVMPEEKINEIVDIISQIIGEKDKKFLEDEIDVVSLARIFGAINQANYIGIPKPRQGETPKGK